MVDIMLTWKPGEETQTKKHDHSNTLSFGEMIKETIELNEKLWIFFLGCFSVLCACSVEL